VRAAKQMHAVMPCSTLDSGAGDELRLLGASMCLTGGAPEPPMPMHAPSREHCPLYQLGMPPRAALGQRQVGTGKQPRRSNKKADLAQSIDNATRRREDPDEAMPGPLGSISDEAIGGQASVPPGGQAVFLPRSSGATLFLAAPREPALTAAV